MMRLLLFLCVFVCSCGHANHTPPTPTPTTEVKVTHASEETAEAWGVDSAPPASAPSEAGEVRPHSVEVVRQSKRGSNSGYGRGSGSSSELEPVPSTPATEESEPLSLVDQALANLRVGNLAFNPPEVMGLGDTHTVELYLSLEEEAQMLVEALDGGAVETAEGVKVSNVMEAVLRGSGFEVHAVTPLSQAVSSKGRTRWAWQVTPKAKGEHTLNVSLSAKIHVEGKESPYVVQTFSRTIKVEVSAWGTIRNFFVGNWQWLWTTVLVPLGVWGWSWVRRRKKTT